MPDLPGVVCPSDARLTDWMAGRVSGTEWDELAQHIEQCAACRNVLERVSDDSGTLAAELRLGSDGGSPADEATHIVRQSEASTGSVGAPSWFQPGQQESDDPLIGTLFGQYRVEEKVGQGGMGTVYRATHTSLNKTVALKLLPPHALTDVESVERFQREMRAIGGLDHPNIVGAHDAGEIDGVHYLVMEFIEGEDLASFIRTHGRLSPRSACKLIRQAAAGLQHAHENGMIHRDIKPSNLILTEGTGRRTVKVLDLGLARLQSQLSEPVTEMLTSTGQIMGTVDFMAPEQAVNTKNADERSDVYSLGITLFYLLAGRAPYGGETPMEKLLAHREAPLPSLSDLRSSIPECVQQVFEQMAAKDPSERISSMAEVVQAVDDCLDQIRKARKTDESTDATPSPDAGNSPTISMSIGLPDPTRPTATPDSPATEDMPRDGQQISQGSRSRSAPALYRWLHKQRAVLFVVVGLLAVFLSYPLFLLLPASNSTTDDASTAAGNDAGLSTTSDDTSWETLFNGRDLSGWTVVCDAGLGGWSVDGGEIVAAAGGVNWLSTNRTYSDFILELEYRLPPDGNSGVFVRCPREGRITGADFLEIQLLDDDSRAHLNLQESNYSGAIWAVVPVSRRATLQPNNWNHLRVEAVKSRIVVSINDEVVLTTDLSELSDELIQTPRNLRNSHGYIGLQRHSQGAAFRNVRICDLTHESVVTAGSALNFDGVDDYVVFPDIPYDGKSPVTIEIWATPRQKPQLDDSTSSLQVWGHGGWNLTLSKNRWKAFRVDIEGRVESDDVIAFDRRQHVAVTFDGERHLLFVDGKRQTSTGVLNGASVSSLSGNIGALLDGNDELDTRYNSRPYFGAIDEFRISRVSRYSSDFSPEQDLQADDDTLVLFRFDEGRRNILNDASGNGNDGQIIEAEWNRSAHGIHDAGRPDRSGISLPGLITQPATLRGIKRWQVETATPRSGITSAVFSPDDQLIALTTKEGYLRIVDARTLELRALCHGHVGAVLSVSWSPDGLSLVSGGEDGQVRFWSSSGESGPVLTGHKLHVNSVAWSPDGRYVASGSRDGTVRLWTSSGRSGPVYRDTGKHIVWLAWKPGTSILTSCDREGKVILRDIDSGSEQGINPYRNGAGVNLEDLGGRYDWSSDGERLALVGRGVWIWSFEADLQQVLAVNDSTILQAAWDPDGQNLVVTGTILPSQIVSTAGGQTRTLGEDTSRIAHCDWSHDGTRIVTADMNGSVALWDSSGELVASQESRSSGHVNALDWSADGTRLVSGGGDGGFARVWSSTGTQQAVFSDHEDTPVHSASWHPSGDLIASATRAGDRSLCVWSPDGTLKHILDGAVAAEWSSLGDRLASFSGQGIKVWSPEGDLLDSLNDDTISSEVVRRLSWSADGTEIAYFGKQSRISIWKPGTTAVRELPLTTPAGTPVVHWSPDSNWILALARGTDYATLVRTDGRVGPVLREPNQFIRAVAWSPNGSQIAIARRDGGVRLWSLAGAPGDDLVGSYQGALLSLAWSKQSNLIAASSDSRQLCVWNAATGLPLWSAVLLPDAKSITFSAAGEITSTSEANVERELVYLVELSDGSLEVIRPSEFERRFDFSLRAPQQ